MKPVNLSMVLGISLGSAYDYIWNTGLASAVIVNKLVIETRLPLGFMANMKGILDRAVKL